MDKNLTQKIIEAKKSLASIKKSAVNPHFKNKYMTLDDIVEAVTPSLSEQGILIYHTIHDGSLVTSITDGLSTIDSVYPLRVENKNDQQLGSALTYGRRYSICCLLGIVADEDDDGNKASQPTPKQSPLDKLKKELTEAKTIDQIKTLKTRWEAGYESLHALGVFDEGLKLIKSKMEAN